MDIVSNRRQLLSSFERFTDDRRTHARTITILPSGVIGLSQGAVRAGGFEDIGHVVLYFEPTSRRVAISAALPDEPGAKRLRHREASGGADLSAKTFLDYYGIASPKKRKYNLLSVPDGCGIVVIQLEAEEETVANSGGDGMKEQYEAT